MTAAILLARPGAWPAYVAPVPATVASIAAPSAAEGAALVYTVTLTATTVGSSTLAYALTGTASGGDVGTPTFSAGVTLAGATLTVPGGVSSFTVTLPTVDDATVEGDETAILTIGGVSSTGTIVDNDAATEVWVDTFGPEPADWLRARYDGTDSYANSNSHQPNVWPQHGSETNIANPLFCCATSMAYNNAAFDTATFTYQVKAWGAADATATSATTDTGTNVLLAWPTTLAPGDYAYRMQDPLAGWTLWRGFRVLPDAVAETLPSMANAYATAVAKAAPRLKPADLSGYAPGGPQRTAYDAMVTRVASLPAVPTAPAAGGGTVEALAEVQAAADLAHLFWLTATESYRTSLIARLVGNGTTTGLNQWPWATFTNDLAFRFGQMARAIAYDTARTADETAFTPAQRTASVAAAAAAIQRHLTFGSFRLLSKAEVAPGGRELGAAAFFGGHSHNSYTCSMLDAVTVAGADQAFTGTDNSSIAINVPAMLRNAPVILRVFDPMQADDGSYHQGKGYAGHSTDFVAALIGIGNALGYNFAQGQRAKAFARTMNVAYPVSDAFHGGPGGHDDSVQYDTRGVSAARRAGDATYAQALAVGGYSEAQLAQGKAIDYHWLASTAPAAATLPAYLASTRLRYMTALHTNPASKVRTSVFFKHGPDGGWNHAIEGVASWVMLVNGQAMFLHSHVNDGNLQSRHNKGEHGQAATANGTICFGDTLTAAANGTVGGNHGRRTRTRRTQFTRNLTTNAVVMAQELGEAVDNCASIPVSSNPLSYLGDIAVKPGATEQTITVTVTAVSSGTATAVSINGGAIAATVYAGSTGKLPVDTAQVYFEITGTNCAVSDTFVFQICKVTTARSFHAWTPEGVVIHGAHYVFPTARPVALRWYTRDVRTPTLATVTAGTLALEFNGGHGRPAGQSVAVEISGVTGGGANFAAANAVWQGTLTAGQITVDVSAASIGNGALTGSFLRVNIGPSGAGLTAPVALASRCREAGPLATAQFVPLLAPTGRVLNDFSWFLGDAALNGTIGYSADEHGGQSASHPVYHRLHNRFDYGTLTGLYGWTAMAIPGDCTVTGISATVTGTAPNRTATVSLTVNGNPYTFSHSEASHTVQ